MSHVFQQATSFKPREGRWKRGPVHNGRHRPSLGLGRAGISLLEVLISIFVITVGLLGLAALIPIGRHEAGEAARIDRGATVGKQSHREMLVRGILDANFDSPQDATGWLVYDAGNRSFQPLLLNGQPGSQVAANALTAPLAIDPLMFAEPLNHDAIFGGNAGGSPAPDTFPYNVTGDAQKSSLNNVPKMARLTLGQVAPRDNSGVILGPWTPQHQQLGNALAERVFRSRDDLLYFTPEDKTFRPIQQYSVTPGGNHQAQTQDQRVAPLSASDYSWMVTLSPNPGEFYDWRSGNYLPGQTRSYTVSVVVFQKRPLVLAPYDGREAPVERTISITFAGSGLGGGSAQIRCQDPVYLQSLKSNQWLLVSGRLQMPDYTGLPNPPNSQLNPPVIARWYRIVTLDDGTGLTTYDADEGPHRDITLDGPDWDSSTIEDLDPSTAQQRETAAAVIDGVIGVYDKTMQIDLLSRSTM